MDIERKGLQDALVYRIFRISYKQQNKLLKKLFVRSSIIKLIDIASNLKWDLKFYKKKYTQKRFRKLIDANKKFKNLHEGQRCFIVGNGPSLSKLDLSKLTNEIVFTANNIMNNRTIYEMLNTDYHVIIDPFYFRQSVDLPEEKVFIDLLKQINYKNKKPVCIVDHEGVEAFKEYGLDKLLDLAYIYQHRNMVDSYSSEISLTGNMPSSQNVIQAAVFSAMYMGFKKIYLIGCDMTSVFLTYESNDDGEYTIAKNSHAYEFSEKEVENFLKELNRCDNEYILNEYGRVFTMFKRIRKYAEKNNIEIINAGIGGGLDVFKRVNYETLFNSHQ